MKQTLVIAFPGCGKTTTVREIRDNRVEKAVDFDLRGTSSLLTDNVRSAQTHLVETLFEEGADFIFTHLGAVETWWLLDRLPIQVIIVVPKYDLYHYWMHRIYKRDGDCPFLRKLSTHYTEWISDHWNHYEKLRNLFGTKRVKWAFLDEGEYITRNWLERFNPLK